MKTFLAKKPDHSLQPIVKHHVFSHFHTNRKTASSKPTNILFFHNHQSNTTTQNFPHTITFKSQHNNTHGIRTHCHSLYIWYAFSPKVKGTTTTSKGTTPTMQAIPPLKPNHPNPYHHSPHNIPQVLFPLLFLFLILSFFSSPAPTSFSFV